MNEQKLNDRKKFLNSLSAEELHEIVKKAHDLTLKEKYGEFDKNDEDAFDNNNFISRMMLIYSHLNDKREPNENEYRSREEVLQDLKGDPRIFKQRILPLYKLKYNELIYNYVKTNLKSNVFYKKGVNNRALSTTISSVKNDPICYLSSLSKVVVGGVIGIAGALNGNIPATSVGLGISTVGALGYFKPFIKSYMFFKNKYYVGKLSTNSIESYCLGYVLEDKYKVSKELIDSVFEYEINFDPENEIDYRTEEEKELEEIFGMKFDRTTPRNTQNTKKSDNTDENDLL